MNFKSDNTASISPQILKAIESVNVGFQNAYGTDDFSLKLQRKFSDFFEKDVQVFLTNTGTAANSLALASLVKPYEAIFCSKQAHIVQDECGAPEFFTSGARLVPLDNSLDKLDAGSLAYEIQSFQALRPHRQKAGCVSITQTTECGTVYTPEEIRLVSKCCQESGIPLHMDGARLANALAFLNVSPAQLTWHQGVDVLTFGATKNGALCAEAVIFFNLAYADHFDYLHKRSGQLMSKGRFFASQFLAYLEHNLWLENAQHANATAQDLATIFTKQGIPIMYPVQANAVFVTLPSIVAEALQRKGVGFYSWLHSNDKHQKSGNLYRFVTSWQTTLGDLTLFEQHLQDTLKEFPQG